jgi:hypothetical protein
MTRSSNLVMPQNEHQTERRRMEAKWSSSIEAHSRWMGSLQAEQRVTPAMSS